MEIENFIQNFGLPGLLIGVFYLLVRAQNDRQSKTDDRKLTIEEKRVEGMFEQARAMATGFTALVQAMASNHTADIESHSDLGAAIAELRGKVDEAIAWRESITPIGEPPRPPRARTNPQGLPITGYHIPRKPIREGG